MLLALAKPGKPLSADVIGSLTNEIFVKFGIPSVFGPHSTRGAGVNLYRSLGLDAQEVIGQGKKPDTFMV